ncbi:MAG: hypothetical protein KKG09_04755 [Verrucomicrobia bacterium]|nr:hypothetical protein [Verrucomicrobiota bacterium]MCG2681536.1 hypothetical protein [Kiritimatiellia bacterium]MBU4248192.1 hypothetical protein [Verrucomicrobiota bacterium]MBU4290126.1 hypothetical protein [Verrucomicrobiota bacterium]MBU4429932.1 hypothetical protein [Verrucomicrobiota bacterium]
MKTQLMMTKCCKCQRVKMNGNWLTEPIFLILKLTEPIFLILNVIYTHTYCPECFEQEMAMIEKYIHSEPVNTTACSGNRIIAA